MRVLFFTVPSKSHLYVPVPLAWALLTAGHEVCVVSQPELASLIEATGLPGFTVGRPAQVELTRQMNEADPDAAGSAAPAPRPFTGNPRQEDYARLPDEFESLVGNLLPVMTPVDVVNDLVDFARDWQPDLIVWDYLTHAGQVAARACGAAHARLLLANDAMGQLRQEFLRTRTDPDHDPMRDLLQPKLDTIGAGFAEDLVLGDFTIDPMPSWVWHAPGVPYLPVRQVPFNGPSIIAEWLFRKPERPRVCITLGNSHRDAGRVEASAVPLIEAVADLDIEVIATLSSGQLAALPSLPDNVTAADWVPLNALLPSCSALIHHGGAGTFAGALENGVPQLIVPGTYWTEKWHGPVAVANGLEDRGAGLYVCDSDQLTADLLRAGLLRVLDDPSFAVNAGKLRAEVSAVPTPHDLVAPLERLTERHRRRPR